jgi:hypothetical protein
LQRLPRPRLWGVALLGCISILPVLVAPSSPASWWTLTALPIAPSA